MTATTVRPAQPVAELKLEGALVAACDRVDSLTQTYGNELEALALKPLHRALLTARAVEMLAAALDDRVMDRILPLMNTKVGFMTDRGPHNTKNPQPYDKATVRRVLVEALLKGFLPFNNEFNIISGGFYGARNGWQRKCEEIRGLTDLDVSPGVPVVREGRTVVRVRATWKMDGHRKELVGADGQAGRVFPIQTNSYSTDDNTIGKAYAKAYRAVYQYATGTRLTEDDDAPPPGSAAPENGDKPAGRLVNSDSAVTNGHGEEVQLPKGDEPFMEQPPPRERAREAGEEAPDDLASDALANELNDKVDVAEPGDELGRLAEEINGAARANEITTAQQKALLARVSERQKRRK
jgi:hypothetical protein